MTKYDVFLPLVIGDWLKGTRGMKAEVKGVYIGLLLFQWDNGFIPSDIDDLVLIEPEVKKVWETIKSKFIPLSEGRLYNEKIEEVRAFFCKQKENGKKGGRPKKGNPNHNPELNPNHNLHNDIDIEVNINSEKEKGPGEKPYQTPIEFLKETNPGKITELFYSSDFRNENRPDFDHFCGQWSLTVEKDGFEFIGDLAQEKKLLAGLTKYLRTVQRNQQNNPMMFKKHMGTMTGEKRSIEDGEKMCAQIAREIEQELIEGK